MVYGPSIFYSEESKAEFIINQIYQFGKNGKIIWPDFMLKFKVNTDKIFFHSSGYIPEIIYTNSFNKEIENSGAYMTIYCLIILFGMMIMFLFMINL